MIKINNDSLSKLIKHLETYGFIKCIFSKNGSLNNFFFGPAGEMLRETVKKEWIHSNVIAIDNNAFTFSSNSETYLLPTLQEAFLSAKSLVNNQLPFGLADTGKQLYKRSSTPEVLRPTKHTGLKYYAFVGQDEAEQYFYRFQQERKRWWRKLSLDPGKYSFAEVDKAEEKHGPVAKIVVNFEWGTHTLETVQYLGGKPFENISPQDENIFSVRIKRKRCLPHLITSEVNLDYAAFSYMCDAYTTKRGRIILKFHRKMAPLKFAFAANPETEEANRDFFELAELICLQLRKKGLPCLAPVKGELAGKKLESQLHKSDALGIPYTAVLSTETLETGILGLYSRDTTLQEHVHISKMPQYGELLMKNY